MLEKLYTHKFI